MRGRRVEAYYYIPVSGPILLTYTVFTSVVYTVIDLPLASFSFKPYLAKALEISTNI